MFLNVPTVKAPSQAVPNWAKLYNLTPNTSDETGIHKVSTAITPHVADSQTGRCCDLTDHLCGSKINTSKVTGRRSAFVVLQNNVTSSARILFRNHLNNMPRTRHVGRGLVRACAQGRRLKVEIPVLLFFLPVHVPLISSKWPGFGRSIRAHWAWLAAAK